jgi:hypothetical protein
MPTIIPPGLLSPDPQDQGEERMTDVQAVELRELCQQLDEPFDAELTQAQASMRIAHLRERLDD